MAVTTTLWGPAVPVAMSAPFASGLPSFVAVQLAIPFP